jgi:hypothetical protein
MCRPGILRVATATPPAWRSFRSQRPVLADLRHLTTAAIDPQGTLNDVRY